MNEIKDWDINAIRSVIYSTNLDVHGCRTFIIPSKLADQLLELFAIAEENHNG